MNALRFQTGGRTRTKKPRPPGRGWHFNTSYKKKENKRKKKEWTKTLTNKKYYINA